MSAAAAALSEQDNTEHWRYEGDWRGAAGAMEGGLAGGWMGGGGVE